MGPVTGQLLTAWSDAVGVDIPGQIKKWDAGREGCGPSGPSPYSFKSGYAGND